MAIIGKYQIDAVITVRTKKSLRLAKATMTAEKKTIILKTRVLVVFVVFIVGLLNGIGYHVYHDIQEGERWLG
ncbi:MAG: hypothetical protein CR981_03085 [Proteobacteria bacterium]|nr:MAG: hypothetical protein CR981_03085 [Pseudomonadota bacterium]